MRTTAALAALWEESLAEGDIPGPYWALVSHPAANEDLLGRAFGEIHMLSHLVGAGNRVDIRALRRLETGNETLEEALSEAKAVAGRRLRYRDARIRELEAEMASAPDLARQLEEAKRYIEDLSRGSEIPALRAENATLKRKLGEQSQYADGLREQHRDARQQAARAKERARELEARLAEGLTEQEVLEADLGAMLLSAGSCSCPERATCPEPGLCGRSVLYVGGRSRLVQHYRALVRRHGGDFIHHDGGQQDSRIRLPELLTRADVVLCPVDCVSHDACLRIKQHCKRLAKRCVFMRSSGLSTLAREIQQLAS